MVWLANIVLFLIGALCFILPPALSWPPAAMASAFGIGAAAVYAAIRMLATHITAGGGGSAHGLTVVGRFLKWYDALVIVGVIAAGIVIGLVL